MIAYVGLRAFAELRKEKADSHTLRVVLAVSLGPLLGYAFVPMLVLFGFAFVKLFERLWGAVTRL
jgi:hypothetical protein